MNQEQKLTILEPRVPSFRHCLSICPVRVIDSALESLKAILETLETGLGMVEMRVMEGSCVSG